MMVQCTKCGEPISPEQEWRSKHKEEGTQVILCANCASASNVPSWLYSAIAGVNKENVVKDSVDDIFLKGIVVFVFLGIFLGVIPFLIGIYYIAFYGYPSTNWPSTPGNIVGTVRTKRGAEIEYAYSVNNVTYKSTRLNSGIISQPRKAIDTYPVGTEVSVYYDPNVPSRAVIEPGISLSTYILTGASIVFILLAVTLLVSELVKQVSVTRLKKMVKASGNNRDYKILSQLRSSLLIILVIIWMLLIYALIFLTV
jgi:hypothetical protein